MVQHNPARKQWRFVLWGGPRDGDVVTITDPAFRGVFHIAYVRDHMEFLNDMLELDEMGIEATPDVEPIGTYEWDYSTKRMTWRGWSR